MAGPIDFGARSSTKVSTCSFWKAQSSPLKLGATKSDCGANAFAGPWRYQTKNFVSWNDCWQIMATDLDHHPAIWTCSWPPSRGGGRASHALVDQGHPFKHDPRSVKGQTERGHFLREAMEPIDSYWHRHNQLHESEPRLVAECLGLRTTALGK